MDDLMSNFSFINKVVDKSELKSIIVWAFRNYGIARAANMADHLKGLGFFYATKAGISLSLEDLRIPPIKNNLLKTTINSIKNTEILYRRGEITTVERFQKAIYTWNNSSESLKQEVVKYFKHTDPLNSIYMMAFSGARANISQVRQLVGMRGLMSDPQGKIIDLPIFSNFREGLTVTDYFISSYGARKGLVDTALRTADSGYLTRRLVDVAQDVIIRESDCGTVRGIVIEEMLDNQKVLISLKQALLGRVLAEDVYNLKSNTIIACSGITLSPTLVDNLLNSGRKSFLVRSPITCDSSKSICQLCYGWNLAHGKMVDLGEAIGIIAAQSIGEPGTQLTMRTFHTGGVFTGTISQSVISPITAIVEYPQNIKASATRTRHGNNALLINNDCKLKFKDFNSKISFLNLTKGSMLVVKNGELVRKNQVIGEYPLDNRVSTEKAQKIVTADFSGDIHLSKIKQDNTFLSSNLKGKNIQPSIIWLLSGKVYNMPDNIKLLVTKNQVINENSLLAKTQVISRYSGRVCIADKKDYRNNKYIQILTSSKVVTNLNLSIEVSDGCKNYSLETSLGDKFVLAIKPKEKIVQGQILANLISDIYKTSTGGIIKYLDIQIAKTSESDQDCYDILGPGYILWISEETHEISKDISLLLVKPGEFVEAGTEVIKNVFANNSGILEVLHKDGIIREIIIKPGYIYSVNYSNTDELLKKQRGFLKPGESIGSTIITDKLVYWEYIQTDLQHYVLIRPVIIYSIPDKDLQLNYSKESFCVDAFDLKLVRRTQFKDGERIKSVFGIDLIKIHLVAHLNKSYENLYCCMNFLADHQQKTFLQFVTIDTLAINNTIINEMETQDIYSKTQILVSHNEYIDEKCVVAQTEFFSPLEGRVESIYRRHSFSNRILLVSSKDLKTFNIDDISTLKVKINDWVYAGDEIADSVQAYHSGQILALNNNQVTMRIGQPYLISSGSFIHVQVGCLVQRGENLATLIFDKVKTGDIVQGLPRIEEILEARKKSDNQFNPHSMLDLKFRDYLSRGLSTYNATRLSILQVQLRLVQEVQLVYQSQDVDISDKHIEVIIRQMTSKVKIECGGDTEYLPGELVDLQKIESVNKSLLLLGKSQASYYPILLGITKASLNTASFISAASFQETTKVLTEAAISGKLDWLRGLKENVIIGRLIPAGTGFSLYSKSLSKEVSYDSSVDNDRSESLLDLSYNDDHPFEDIILDDRVARHYSFDSNYSESKS
uniref:DNA-directed RNA polymerase n=1 Tax=Gastroclonium compressum TaxID=1852973 RepID=A0A173G009_GASCM|nr:RNA polymerase beta' subunit [Coeloseira compressa]ANH09616.1 RNA polymerase beta' subunit [Coeloseira compressa]